MTIQCFKQFQDDLVKWSKKLKNLFYKNFMKVPESQKKKKKKSCWLNGQELSDQF